jgi:hypothetical protein
MTNPIEDGPMAGTRAINALLRSRPDRDALDGQWADWFERKANVFDLIASRDPHLAKESAALAADARACARRLRAGEVAR